MSVFGELFFVLGCLIIVGGWWSYLCCFFFKKTSSLIPFLGSVFLILGVYLHPDQQFFNQLKPWVWLALVVDLGTLPMLLMSVLGKKSQE